MIRFSLASFALAIATALLTLIVQSYVVKIESTVDPLPTIELTADAQACANECLTAAKGGLEEQYLRSGLFAKHCAAPNRYEINNETAPCSNISKAFEQSAAQILHIGIECRYRCLYKHGVKIPAIDSYMSCLKIGEGNNDAYAEPCYHAANATSQNHKLFEGACFHLWMNGFWKLAPSCCRSFGCAGKKISM